MKEQEPLFIANHEHDQDLLLFIGGPKDYGRTSTVIIQMINECIELMKEKESGANDI